MYWEYCPECGSEEFEISTNYPGDEERRCAFCGQYWFPNTNYTSCVQLNLRDRLEDKKRIKEIIKWYKDKDATTTDLRYLIEELDK